MKILHLIKNKRFRNAMEKKSNSINVKEEEDMKKLEIEYILMEIK